MTILSMPLPVTLALSTLGILIHILDLEARSCRCTLEVYDGSSQPVSQASRIFQDR